ncbi:guanylyltransferase [bacterium]|nr:MAG: guanylyltransferase [bacterium]
MNFDDFDARMRGYEFQKETRAPRGYLIARLDGRGFTRLTKESLTLEKPFDPKFHQSMSITLAHLFDCGFTVRLGYSQSDEISLLFEQDGIPFDRKIYKILSVLAGEASAKFSLEMGYHGAFDCRLSLLPDEFFVIDYFRWRQMDAARNALSAHCYWVSRRQGLSARDATARWSGATQAEKRAFLGENDIDFDTLPYWQTRGFVASWHNYEKEAIDQKTGLLTIALRRKLAIERELPFGDDFAGWLEAKM